MNFVLKPATNSTSTTNATNVGHNESSPSKTKSDTVTSTALNELEKREKLHLEKIEKLNVKLSECESKNLLLKYDMERLNDRCVELSQLDVKTKLELQNLKQTIQHMCMQFNELSKKCQDNEIKLKVYEQR